MIERLKAYRQHLLKAGKLLEARTVDRCIAITKEASNPTDIKASSCTFNSKLQLTQGLFSDLPAGGKVAVNVAVQ